eukprot:TRINITY_DN47387_c0_g1_i1.p1 TRINITY_DN47387_c0_g1~~TRINITY_DN47387_c0_g1_i1.p1  ORF type:complete len:783 (+),score=233.24 TRINITY_DN47387_c0_g1_i1:49-2397(+)
MGGQKSKVASEPRESARHVIPGNGAPVMTGIRVVELATVVAAPSAGRLLAHLGAEVVKVEEPRGDTWRQMLAKYEKGRGNTFGSMFEVTNLGKKSVVLDVKAAEGVRLLHELLAGADVFLTNIRTCGLERLGLGYGAISQRHPHLVYAHLNAWGREGPDVDLPGYDIGAFWAMTGMGASITAEGQYAHYPTGFGDSTTGLTLVAGVSFALANRTVTGRGALVDGCLLRTGAYCMQAQAASAQAGARGPPDYDARENLNNPLWAVHKCQDGGKIAVVSAAGGRKELGAALSISGALDMDSVRKAFAEIPVAEASRALRAVSIPHVPMGKWPESLIDDTAARDAGCFMSVADVPDVNPMIAPPFDLGCSPQHGARLPGGLHGAPLLGEHTAAVLEHGWQPRPPAAELKRVDGAPEGRPVSLDYVSVIELSDGDMCVPSCCAMLSDYGASVTCAEIGGTQERMWPTLAKQMRRGKKVLRQGSAEETLSAVRDQIAKTAAGGGVVVFCVSYPLAELRRAGLDPDTLRREYPSLIVAALTTQGLQAEGREGRYAAGDAGCFVRASGFHTMLSKPQCDLPAQLGALATSMSLMAAVGCALFHLRRTGEGQLVDVNYLRSGAYAVHQTFAFMVKDPAKRAMLDMTPEEARKYHPIPTCLCHRTKDGYWIQLLGVDLGRHLGKLLKALKLGHTKLRVACGFCCCCDCNVCEPTILKKVSFMFEVWNSAIEEKIGELTREQLGELFKEHDVWYCDIRMPAQLRSSKQLIETEAFDTFEGEFVVKAPMRMVT